MTARSKTVILRNDVAQGSDEWLAARAGSFTGTGAEKLLTHSDSRRVVDGVIANYAETELSSFGGNFHTKRGHVLEDQAISLYGRIYSTTVNHTGFVTNSQFPRCLYSPDGLDDDNMYLVEVKCFSEKVHLKIVTTGEIPFKVIAQVQFGMMITGFKRARIVFFHPGVDLKYKFKAFEIKANAAAQRRFKEILKGV